MKTIAVLLTVGLFTPRVFAQSLRVHVSNDDPHWGETITISYTAPADSPFSLASNTDTLYCAANMQGVRPEHAIIKAMRHIKDSMYETSLTIPDSTYTLWVEICTPTNRAPDGITIFTCRTADGKPTPGAIIKATLNMDSALNADLALYPKHYTSYIAADDKARQLSQAGEITMNDSDWKRMLTSSTDRLLQNPDNTPSWHLALASTYFRRRMDSLANISLANVSKCTTFDPIFNDADFWNHFFAPSMKKGGGMTIPTERGRLIAPLVERFPKTTMGAYWLERMAYDTLLPANIFRSIATQSASSHDVDLLSAIADGYGYKNGPAYDLAEAMKWNNRAEECSRSKLSFFSGDNIYGSMGRLPRILAMKTSFLARMGKINEAVAVADTAMRIAKEQYEKQMIAGVLARAYLDADRIEDAKRAYGKALALSTRGTIDGLSELFAKCKQGTETEKEFSQHLIDTYGHGEKLPAIPDFNYTTLDGKSGSLSGLHGKVVVLDCWFTTCPGCVVEKNSLNKLVGSFAGDTNVVFLSIALNDEATLKRYLKSTPSEFKIVPNGQNICDKIGVTGYPTHIIIDRDGKTLGNDVGGDENGGELMRPKIEKALGKS